MRLPFTLRLPKVQMIGMLLLVFITALGQYPLAASLRLLISAVGFSAVIDVAVIWIRKKPLFVPYGSIVSGLIITLLINPDASSLYIAITAAIAVLSKHFLKIFNRQIFNPAAAGLFAGAIIFKQHVAWWGITFQSPQALNPTNLLTFLVLLVPLYTSWFRLRRYPTSLTFLISYAILTQIFARGWSWVSILMNLLNPTLIFYAIVMLPEPKTSPNKFWPQIGCGFGVACIIFIFMVSGLNTVLDSRNLLPDLLLLALLLGNLMSLEFR